MQKILEFLQRKVALMITKTILVSLNDSGAIQKMVLEGFKYDRRSNVDRYQEFGFSSNPPAGSEVIMLSLGGSRSHNIGIASENRDVRPTGLEEGESILYNAFGDYVKIKADGTIEVKASTKVLIDCPMVQMTGDLEVDGNIQAQGNIISVGGNISAVAGNVSAGGNVSATGTVLGSAGVSDGAGSIAGFRTAYNSHTHSETGTTTSTPTPTV